VSVTGTPPHMKTSLLHGGDLGAARKLFPGAPEPLIDLSTGINPHSYPLPQLPSDAFARLPEPAALDSLCAIAAAAYGAPSRDHVIAAPGTQILLPLAMSLVPPGRAAVLSPTYGEFARVAAHVGHQVSELTDIAAVASANLAIVANPNNPDGRLFAREALLGVADELQRRRGLLLIDEAFMDVAPDGLALDDCPHGNVMVLRSFGKFFGLAGVRLGFAIGAPELVARVATTLGPWPVSGPAIAIGQAALADVAWADGMRRRLADEMRRLQALLAGAGLEAIGGTSLLHLVRTPRAADLFQHLGRAGILVRRFDAQPSWLRFGLPGSEAAWERLRVAISVFR
jgi:cobalamin biosynthetic protein CobC